MSTIPQPQVSTELKDSALAPDAPEANDAMVTAVLERDLDHLLLEELQCSSEFRSWFIEKCGGYRALRLSEARTCKIRRSKSRVSVRGETDILLSFLDSMGRPISAIFIEDKTSTGFTSDDQPDRYAAEANYLVQEAGYRSAVSVLVAPTSLCNAIDAKQFSARISLEDIRHWLDRRTMAEANEELRDRLTFKIHLLDCALDRARRSYAGLAEKNDAVTALFTDYAAFVRSAKDGLLVTETGTNPLRSNTIRFTGVDWDARLGRIDLKHELNRADANINFYRYGALVGIMRESIEALLKDGMKVERGGRTGESWFVRIKTPRVDNTASFQNQRQLVVAGYEAVRQLASWYRENRAAISTIILSAAR